MYTTFQCDFGGDIQTVAEEGVCDTQWEVECVMMVLFLENSCPMHS